ncbi:hypothetical protein CN032_19630 [Salmonella enterica subsp. enterica serovar Newport]|nr:hypothetical protein [Salmonella enterica subsp. enterica serovar Newport]EHA9709962.1 hypothetical protein [Salmonella enterica subsp. enterica serovar Newport]EHA9742035.1 hypothetical protein [Salmonella enterica subsp. enterica serovar Newport]EMB1507757.1 hypothetical protein [Salmonella enterica]
MPCKPDQRSVIRRDISGAIAMPTRAVLPRILGALFYYSPERPEVKALFDCLPTLPELYPWRDRGHIESLCASWSLPDDDALTWQFSVLFEGQGKMPVPPWGFRYLELLQRNTVSAFYARLAVVATCYLQDVQQQQGLQPENKRLFF